LQLRLQIGNTWEQGILRAGHGPPCIRGLTRPAS
jgi:hypothetical protein